MELLMVMLEALVEVALDLPVQQVHLEQENQTKVLLEVKDLVETTKVVAEAEALERQDKMVVLAQPMVTVVME